MLLFLNGVGMGLFAAPNRPSIMNSLPTNRRGVGAGMSTTFQNAAMVLSIGIFFSLIITGLAHSLPQTLYSGLTTQHVPSAQASAVAALPPVSVLFASLLGYNPVQQLLGPQVLAQLPAANANYLTGRAFLPRTDLESVLPGTDDRLRLRHRRVPRGGDRLRTARQAVRARSGHGPSTDGRRPEHGVKPLPGGRVQNGQVNGLDLRLRINSNSGTKV